MSNNITPTESAQILQAIGRVSGQMEMLIGQHREQARSIEGIRAEIRDQEARFRETVAQTEQRLSEKIDASLEPVNKRIDGLANRVGELEKEDKRLIEKVAKVSAVGGTISGGLIAGAIELIKHVGK
jgi:DNA repair exonuclease SbcCD ATPase subunit